MPLAAHCTWKHEIDSRGQGITDEGDMFLLKNDDAMEIGVMVNPSTGKEEVYKEYWTGPPTESEADEPLKLSCVVAEKSSDALDDTRGLIVRVGNYCQGLLEIGQAGSRDICVERFIKIADSGKWNRDRRSGTSNAAHGTSSLSVPCTWVCEERKLGDVIRVSEATWTIVELVE
jgi:hypothetical protein